MEKIIGISGKAESGKDTVATIIQKFLEEDGKRVLIVHFGDLVKWTAEKFFGWNGAKDEKGRMLLQKVGASLRDYDDGFWAKTLMDIVGVFMSSYDYVIVPDVRYKNEVAEIELFGNLSYTVRVERPGHENKLTEEQRQHPSETELDDESFDAVIMNDVEDEFLVSLILEVYRVLPYIKDGRKTPQRCKYYLKESNPKTHEGCLYCHNYVEESGQLSCWNSGWAKFKKEV